MSEEKNSMLRKGYKTTNLQMDNGYSQFMEHMLKIPKLPYWEAKEEISIQIFSDTIIFSYIGIYLGIIFLITAGAVLALQQLTQAADNAERYHLLSKLGTREEERRKSLN